MRYKFCEPGETIYSQGDLGEEYYIILKGKIQVQIPDPIAGSQIVQPEEEVIEELIDEVPNET